MKMHRLLATRESTSFMAERIIALLFCLVTVGGCSSTRTIVVPVPPRVDLQPYRILGIVDFSANADPTVSQIATRQFQERVQDGQPGTRFVELGAREKLLGVVGAAQFDAEAMRKIGAKYHVDAVFLGEIAYSDPKTDVRVGDPFRMQGAVSTEMRGDLSARLIETKSGASVWSSSSWAKRQLGSARVSIDHGISGRVTQSNPRHDMVPNLVYHVTTDFRPTSVRRRVEN